MSSTAVFAWRDAGAFEPLAALLEELRELRDSGAGGECTGMVQDALELAAHIATGQSRAPDHMPAETTDRE